MKRFVTLPLFLGICSCLPGPTEKELNGTRFFAEAVIQVELSGVTNDFGNLKIGIELNSGKKLRPKAGAAVPQSASFALVMPDAVQYSDLKKVTFRLPGYKLLEVDYASVQKEIVSPSERKVEGYNSLGRCQDQMLFDPPEPEFEFASALFSFPRAYATSYTYTCKITYRERQKIKVTLELE